jgi:ParB/RepB/Spo0J family partition protein
MKMSKKDDLKYINVIEIFEPEESLRKVDRNTEKYQGLVESIRSHGIMNPITVRELKNEEGSTIYGLVDGLHRLSACKDVGMNDIPCHVIDVEEGKLIESQIIANVHKIETKPVEYSKAILTIIESNPLLSREELATSLAKTTSWLSERLGLLKLTDPVAKLVDSGDIKLSNAYVLAKLPPEEQPDFVDRALTMPPQQFTPTVNARIKEIRDAKRKGKDTPDEVFKPIAILRGRSEIIEELEQGPRFSNLCKGCNSIEDAFKMALKWVLNLDPESAEMQRVKDDERKAERLRQQEKSKLERTRKRAEEAAQKAAELKKEAESLVAH